jgi:hypothetical protein
MQRYQLCKVKFTLEKATNSQKVGVGGQRHASAALPPGKNRYPLYKRLSGNQVRSGRVRKISPPLGFDNRTAKLVASHYNDCAIRAFYQLCK